MKASSEKQIGRFPLALLCCLSQGHSMLPYLLFSSLAIAIPGNADFFVPIVVVYTVQRAALVALRGLGEITNPFRIFKAGLFVALIGTVLLLLSPLSELLESVGALFVGVGFSSLGAMFRPLFALMTEKEPACRKSAGPGSILYLILSLLIVLFTGKAKAVVEAVFFLYILGAVIIVCMFDQNKLFENRPAFDVRKRNPIYFVFGILNMLCLLVMRQYKQSGVSALLWLAPLAAVTAIILETFRNRRAYRHFVYKNYWAGAMKNFLSLFSLLYFATIGKKNMVTLALAAIIIGGLIPGLVAKLLRRYVSESALADFCMLSAAVLAFLVVVPSDPVNFIAILLCEALTGTVSRCNTADYQNDSYYLPFERALTMERVYISGGVLHQVVLISALHFLGKYMAHQNLLLAHAGNTPDPSLALALRISGIISCALLLTAALMVVYSKKRHRKEPMFLKNR